MVQCNGIIALAWDANCISVTTLGNLLEYSSIQRNTSYLYVEPNLKGDALETKTPQTPICDPGQYLFRGWFMCLTDNQRVTLKVKNDIKWAGVKNPEVKDLRKIVQLKVTHVWYLTPPSNSPSVGQYSIHHPLIWICCCRGLKIDMYVEIRKPRQIHGCRHHRGEDPQARK